MSIIQFPKKRSTISAALRVSTLAKSCRRLEAKIVLEGDLAEDVFVAAGKRQLSVEALTVDGMRLLYGRGNCA